MNLIVTLFQLTKMSSYTSVASLNNLHTLIVAAVVGSHTDLSGYIFLSSPVPQPLPYSLKANGEDPWKSW